MILQELVPLLNFRNSRDNCSTICSSGTRKAESEISYGPAERENQFKQSKIYSEEKVKVHKS